MIDTQTFNWHVEGFVEKFLHDDDPRLMVMQGDDLIRVGVKPYDVTFFEGNLLTNAGVQRIFDQLTGATSAPMNNTTSRIGVGDDATSAVATNTNLGVGGSNRYWMTMDATYPSRSSQTVSWKATFTGGVANYAWQEWGIDSGAAQGITVTAPLLNRKVTSLGTKTSAATWAFTVTTTIA